MAPLPSDLPRDREARVALRATLRARRRSLAAPLRRAAARAVLRHLLRLRWLKPGLRLAAYAAIDGELDTDPILGVARLRGCRLYLPRITRRRAGGMRFVPAAGVARRNRYGIPEPPAAPGRTASGFDLILVPLVAFDRRGARLGMGAGFYDRALAFRRLRRVWPGPRLVGLGYSFQEVERLSLESHDVRLDGVITEHGACFFRGADRMDEGPT